MADVCASFQKAIVDVLVRKSMDAVAKTSVDTLVVAGGVACNGVLRSELEQACEKEGVRLLLAHPSLCTDNAAMIAATAAIKVESGIEPSIGGDIDPNLSLFSSQPEGDLERGMALARKLKDRQVGQSA